MIKEWKKDFFKMLSDKLDEFTEDNVLIFNEELDEWVLNNVFATSLKGEDFVLLQAMPCLVREDVLILEIYIELKRGLNENVFLEIQKTIQQLNCMIPLGTMGVTPSGEQAYLRHCIPLDFRKSMQMCVEDVVLVYEILMGCVSTVYPGMKAMWEEGLSFEQVVEKEMLLVIENID